MRYSTPTTLGEAVGLLADGPARILAGGTDIYPSLGDKPLRGAVVDISGLAELSRISHDAGTIRMGAMTSWASIARGSLPPCFDGLKAAARQVGSIQIQNRGSIGGNLCTASPAADGVPPLLALGADVELASARGVRRLPLSDFMLGYRKTALAPDELLTGVVVSLPPAHTASVFHKLGSRQYLVISILMVAITLTADTSGHITAARIAVGACSPVARRLPKLEATLVGLAASTPLSAHVSADHLVDLVPIDDVRATAAYRRHAALECVGRALDECAARLRA